MATAATLRSLPSSLAILFFICLAAPIWSLAALASPATVWHDQGAWAAILLIVSYWLMPPAMAFAIVTRSPIFLPLFVGECVSLLLYVSIYGGASSDVYLWGRYAAIGLTAMAGVFVSSKDLIAPFLQLGGAEWRKTPRLPSSIRMRAAFGGSDVPVDVVVDDFSHAGMAISLHADDLKRIGEMRRGDKLTVLGASGKVGSPSSVACSVAWVKTDGPLVSLGLKAEQQNAMALLVQTFRSQRRGLVLPFWLGRLWLNRGVRRVMMVVWAGLIIAAFGSPAVRAKDPATASYRGSTPPAPAPAVVE